MFGAVGGSAFLPISRPLQLTTMFKRVYYGKKNDTLPGASVVVVVDSDGPKKSHSPLFIL